jgi:hypothetical protein
MNIGVAAATYCEVEDVNLTAADLDDKIRRVAENKWADLTVEKLLAMIDQKHLDTSFTGLCASKFNTRAFKVAGPHFYAISRKSRQITTSCETNQSPPTRMHWQERGNHDGSQRCAL